MIDRASSILNLKSKQIPARLQIQYINKQYEERTQRTRYKFQIYDHDPIHSRVVCDFWRSFVNKSCAVLLPNYVAIAILCYTKQNRIINASTEKFPYILFNTSHTHTCDDDADDDEPEYGIFFTLAWGQ